MMAGNKRKIAGLAALVGFLAVLLYYTYVEIRKNCIPNFPAVPKGYLIMIVLLLLIVTGVGIRFFFMKKKPTVEFAAAGLAFLFGVIYMVALPPFTSPDETWHYTSTYALSNILLGQDAVSENGIVLVRESDLMTVDGDPDHLILSENVTRKDMQFVADHLFDPVSNVMVESDADEEVNMRLLPSRLPQAIGLTLARVLRLSFVAGLFMGRFFGLLFYTAVFYFALKWMPRGKLVMAVVGLFPMSVSLAASYSYDSTTLALCYLFIAYTMHLRYQEGQITNKQAIGMVLLLMAFTPWKMTYAAMVSLCLILPVKKFRNPKAYFICAASAVAAVAVCTLAANAGQLTSVATGTDTALDYVEADSYTLKELLTSPIRVFRMIFYTIWYQLDWYYSTMVGQVLGELDTGLETRDLFVMAFFVTAFLAAVQVEGEEPAYEGKDRWIVLGVLALMVVMIELSMAVGWTPNTDLVIAGVQGRYFLGLLPLMLLFIQGKGLTWKKPVNYPLLYMIVILHVVNLARVVERISVR